VYYTGWSEILFADITFPLQVKAILFTDQSFGDVKYVFKSVGRDVNSLQLVAVNVCSYKQRWAFLDKQHNLGHDTSGHAKPPNFFAESVSPSVSRSVNQSVSQSVSLSVS